MNRVLALATVIALGVSGCANGPFDGIARERDGDRIEDRPEAAKVAALMRVADATAAAGDYGSAISMYRRAHDADPLNIAVLNRLGATLLQVGANSEAASAFRAATRAGRHPESIEGFARALIALDQPRSAISQLEVLLVIEERPSTYNAFGVAYDMLGDHGAAQAYYRTGLDIAPAHLGLANNLGLSLAVSGRHAEAIDVLRRTAADPRATARNRLNLALAYGLAGETEAAAETARIDLDEGSVQRNLAFYATLRALGDSRQTIRAIGSHNAPSGSSVAKQTSRH